MALNLIDLVQKNLSSPVLRQISSLLGESEASTQTAVAAAVPAVIGALMKQTSTPTGARDLAAQLDKTDTSFLSNLTSSLGGGARSLMDSGSNLVHGLFGSQLGAVNDGLSRASGMGKGAIASLLAVITPIVMGVLAKTKRDQGLDATGLSNLLGGQSSFLSGLLPAGMGDILGIGGLLGGAGAKVRATAERAGGYAADTGRAAARTTQRAASEGSSFVMKLLPLAALALLGLILWAWLSGRDKKVEAAPPLQGVAAEVQTDLRGFVDSATSALRGITDVDTARAALPKLQAATQGITGLSSKLTTLPAAARSSIATAASTSYSSVQSLVDKVLAIPGVGDIVRPATTSLMDALAKLR